MTFLRLVYVASIANLQSETYLAMENRFYLSFTILMAIIVAIVHCKHNIRLTSKIYQLFVLDTRLFG